MNRTSVTLVCHVKQLPLTTSNSYSDQHKVYFLQSCSTHLSLGHTMQSSLQTLEIFRFPRFLNYLHFLNQAQLYCFRLNRIISKQSKHIPEISHPPLVMWLWTSEASINCSEFNKYKTPIVKDRVTSVKWHKMDKNKIDLPKEKSMAPQTLNLQ